LERAPRVEPYDESKFAAEREDWLADSLFGFHINEIEEYRTFVLDQTPYSTQHGVKGDQFEKVLVVFDDTEANWTSYSFSRLFTPKATGTDPTEGQAEKSRNLAYVCFSRAKQDLRVLLFTKNPTVAREELCNSKLFRNEQITILQ
jgi:DNA helicase II / ATP-dependent DNA helicase PcrA